MDCYSAIDGKEFFSNQSKSYKCIFGKLQDTF
jgi:hypothetical protein